MTSTIAAEFEALADVALSPGAEAPSPCTPGSLAVLRAVERTCDRIAPLWPLKHFVAVNPYLGLVGERFESAAHELARVASARMWMPRAFLRERFQAGAFGEAHLWRALEMAPPALKAGIDLTGLRAALALDEEARVARMPTLAATLSALDAHGTCWRTLVVEQISKWCAARFDDGQAAWASPWHGDALWAAWRAAMAVDRSPEWLGVKGFHRHLADVPADAGAATAWAARTLGLDEAELDDYLHAALREVGGWAAWARQSRWQAALDGGTDDTLPGLLAVRATWDALLFLSLKDDRVERAWAQARAKARIGTESVPRAMREDALLQSALEIAHQERVAASLRKGGVTGTDSVRPAVQAVFCIDVRSEVFRRALEAQDAGVRTLGFAGFFGLSMEYRPLGATRGGAHCPVLLKPAYTIHEAVADMDDARNGVLASARRRALSLAGAWKSFKTSAVSCFSFVEAGGLLFAGRLLGDGFGWSRPVDAPRQAALRPSQHGRLGPRIRPLCGHDHAPGESCGAGAPADAGGIPVTERVKLAAGILRAMSLPRPFARVVLLAGHGSSTVNNPHATGLDCGACGGHAGDANARVAAALLNDPDVRTGLATQGVTVPVDTVFVPALHDTTTDDVRLFDTEPFASSHADDLRALAGWLEGAGRRARAERAAGLGLAGADGATVEADIRLRARDWSQVRPEWGLAGNAAFIAAPRARTAGADFGGRAFLHEYDWTRDDGFGVLELVMTAPMVVASWINLQYHASTVDNRVFGSGNKVLHNVVGGSLGVLEGNGGDLRTGLPLQSVHDGRRWMHEPLRLSVYLEAPQAAIDAVIAKHEHVRHLVEHGWVHLFRIDDADGSVHRRQPGGWIAEPAGGTVAA